MDDLLRFLRTRLTEDEQTALAHRQWSPHWYHDDTAGEIRDSVNQGTVAFVPAELDAAHIVRHDPARSLAEVEAKRQILDHLTYELADHGGDNPWWYDDKLIPILRLLALPYAGHPDYRPEWAL
ncbi:DUF6221 family protein [Streptomyces virginiae]